MPHLFNVRLMRWCRACTWSWLLGPICWALCTTADALPSFARQTGMACAQCHVGAFGPQLTPYGTLFKLRGYTDHDDRPGHLPLAAMVQASFTRTASDQNPPPEHGAANNSTELDQASLFIAGRWTDHVGSFVQITYDGIAKTTALDNMDIRYADSTTIAGHDALLGLTLDNAPGVQDPFNTLPAWGFPYIHSGVAPGMGGVASLLSDGPGLAHRVTGLSAYGLLDGKLYAELGAYAALSPSLQSHFGLGRDGDVGRVSANYWRLAYLENLGDEAYSAGLLGFNAGLRPSRLESDASNRLRDIGIDGMAQWHPFGDHAWSLYGRYIREHQRRDFDQANGLADNSSDSLRELWLNASYYYRQTWGATVGAFRTSGSMDASLYGGLLNAANGKPDTSGFLLQADWTLWGRQVPTAFPLPSTSNLRVGAQYWFYSTFAGAHTNYDGQGRKAKDNNTFFLFAWLAL